MIGGRNFQCNFCSSLKRQILSCNFESSILAPACAVDVTCTRCVQGPDAQQPSRRALVRWLPLAAVTSLSSMSAAPALAAPYPQGKTEAEWFSILGQQQRFVLREGGTEPPSSSLLVREQRVGEYKCAGCGASLFLSDLKFEARTGAGGSLLNTGVPRS